MSDYDHDNVGTLTDEQIASGISELQAKIEEQEQRLAYFSKTTTNYLTRIWIAEATENKRQLTDQLYLLQGEQEDREDAADEEEEE
jgi:hypothetical protein